MRRRRFLTGISGGALALFALGNGCATQEDSAVDPGQLSAAGTPSGGTGGETAGSSGAGKTGGGGTDATGGSAGSGGSSAATAGGSAGGSSGSGGGGTGPVAGTPAVGGSPDMSSGGAAGAGGSDSGCTTNPDCDDKNVCTTDTCLQNTCSHTANTVACATDNNPCTDDVCNTGECKHTKNAVCECMVDKDCDDKNGCTDEHCTLNKCSHTNNTDACTDDAKPCTLDVCAAGACTHNDNGTCGVGTPFTVDSFNSSADWTAQKTTPDQRAILLNGITLATQTNLEGNADLFVAEGDTGSIEFGLASMVGLGKFRIGIRASEAGTGDMLSLAVWNGTAWSAEKKLSAYAAIPTGGNYAVIEVPTVDFAQPLAMVTKLRLSFNVTGGAKNWQIDDIAAAK